MSQTKETPDAQAFLEGLIPINKSDIRKRMAEVLDEKQPVVIMHYGQRPHSVLLPVDRYIEMARAESELSSLKKKLKKEGIQV